jgi:hypothetical protein
MISPSTLAQHPLKINIPAAEIGSMMTPSRLALTLVTASIGLARGCSNFALDNQYRLSVRTMDLGTPISFGVGQFSTPLLSQYLSSSIFAGSELHKLALSWYIHAQACGALPIVSLVCSRVI